MGRARGSKGKPESGSAHFCTVVGIYVILKCLLSFVILRQHKFVWFYSFFGEGCKKQFSLVDDPI